MSKQGRHTIHGHYTKEDLERVLGEPAWGWEETPGMAGACELEPAETLWTAGWGAAAACARVCIHPNGLCIAGAWNVDSDNGYALALYHLLNRNLARQEEQR